MSGASQRRVLSIGLTVGSRLPVYCTSMWRVLLASLPETEARVILDRSERRKLTPQTVTDLEALTDILRNVAEDDYAAVDQELEIGLRSIAVPLRKQPRLRHGGAQCRSPGCAHRSDRTTNEFARRRAQTDIARLLS
jgi:DNA-binding IclR family transcriptional regulator